MTNKIDGDEISRSGEPDEYKLGFEHCTFLGPLPKSFTPPPLPAPGEPFPNVLGLEHCTSIKLTPSMCNTILPGLYPKS